MKNALKFLTDNGHSRYCEKVRGPEHENWVDESYRCTCGYEKALGEVVATLRKDGTNSPLRLVRSVWDRRVGEPKTNTAERRIGPKTRRS